MATLSSILAWKIPWTEESGTNRGIAGTEAIAVLRIGRTLYAVFHGLLPAEA